MPITVNHSTPADGTFSAQGATAWNDVHTLSMDTNRLLGRSTAGTGTVEEITLGTNLTLTAGVLNAAGGGDVVGPASSADNAIARFDGTTGKLITDSNVSISDTGVMEFLATSARIKGALNAQSTGLLFQTNQTDSFTYLSTIPSGAGVGGGLISYIGTNTSTSGQGFAYVSAAQYDVGAYSPVSDVTLTRTIVSFQKETATSTYPTSSTYYGVYSDIPEIEHRLDDGSGVITRVRQTLQTFDLLDYAELRLFDNTTSTTGYVGIKAPATVTTAVTYTLPAADGSSGQVLATNGSGTLSWASAATGTVTSVDLTAGTGISVSGGPITTSGSITVTNTAPDQVVSLTGAGTTNITGTYPSFTITSNDQYVGTVTSVGGTGTVNGLTLTGTVTSSGSLTLGGTLSGVSLTTQVSGTLPVANGGTGQTTYTDGQLLIGNTSGNTLTKATLTAGTNVTITNGNGSITIAAASLVNFTESVNSAAPNATVPVVRLLATNAATNVDIALSPKGTGALTAQVADNAASGGNKRGNYAVDLRTERSVATQVASGANATALGGFGGAASGVYSTSVGGYNNNATAEGALCIGGGFFGGGSQGNNSTGSASAVVGGSNNLANSGASAILGGRYATTRSIVGLNSCSPCSEPIAAAAGAQQTSRLILGRATTNATPTVLTSNTVAATTTNQVVLPNNSAYYFKGKVIAAVTAAGNTSAWTFEGAIKRGANAASTAIVGSVITNLIAQDSGASTWAISVTADTTNGALAVTVTGQAATTIRWVAHIETTEVTY